MKKKYTFFVGKIRPPEQVSFLSRLFGQEHQRDKTYQYKFPHICVCCGQSPEKYVKFRVDEQLGNLYRYADVRVPYCADHLEEIKKFKLFKFICQFLFVDFTFVAAFVVVSGYLGDKALWFSAIIGLIICAPILQLFNFLLLGKVMRILDRDDLFEATTNTLGFTADITMGVIRFHFSNFDIASLFKQANKDNQEISGIVDPTDKMTLLKYL
jgi:hypothetical protein